ncbi:MAG: hypothetical protein OXE84_14500 [Rhodobacteraceae bacterium]|nr:hypothetical protein [Paracoccaceae bacterium]
MTDHASKTVPHEIDGTELLGRHEWSGSTANKIVRRQASNRPLNVPKNIFRPPENCHKLSVDRMDHAERGELAELAEENTTRKNATFRGWYILSASDVICVGCDVQASASCQNPYHADIVVPVDPSETDPKAIKDNRTKYAQRIARCVKKFIPFP